MVVPLFRNLANASKHHITRNLGGHQKEKHLYFLGKNEIPELRTLTVAPEAIRSTRVRVSHDTYRNRLTITIDQEHVTNFVFREEDILVLSTQPFSPTNYRETLRTYLKT